MDRYILKLRQAMSLEDKIKFSNRRINQWYEHFSGKVYVSFSGGKDSTVLLDLVRKQYSDVEAVFVDTGLEYPEIRKFVKTFENITILRPEMRFDKVISEYGFPVISKEISECVHNARIYLKNKKHYKVFYEKLMGTLKIPNSEKLSPYNCSKWQFLLDAPFKISNKCCNIMKKKPAKKFFKETGKVPYIATLACESRLREQHYLKSGCNAFQNKIPTSTPLAFWTEQDILEYLYRFNIPFASVYGEIKKDKNGGFYTTGCQRTGCMFCAYGCQLEKYPNRFQKLAISHPKQYDYCMNVLGMREVLEFIGIQTEKNIQFDGQVKLFQ